MANPIASKRQDEIELHELVTQWLNDTGTDINPIDVAPDSPIDWQLAVDWPEGSGWTINLVKHSQEDDFLQFVASVSVNDYHRACLEELGVEGRIAFQENLVDALLNRDTMFALIPVESTQTDEDPGVIHRFLVEARAYKDGLDKTVFFDKLLHVHTTRLQGVIHFQRTLGTSETPSENSS